MTTVSIRDAVETDFAAIVALNASEVVQTSEMDRSRLLELAAIATCHRVAVVDGHIAAFLLAMKHGCDYANDNFGWFAARFPAFVYVDRIVVGERHKGLRLGTLLYKDLFAYASSIGIATIACEYNLVPPNEPSRRFHDRFGFHEVGRQWPGNGSKQVSLQVAEVR